MRIKRSLEVVMSRRPVLLSSVSLLSFLITAPLKAQNKPVQCLDTCEPDSTSGSYADTYAARPRSKNVSASSTVLARRANDTSGEANATLPGSESYTYAIPVLSLPGRNGLDVNLMLSTTAASGQSTPQRTQPRSTPTGTFQATAFTSVMV